MPADPVAANTATREDDWFYSHVVMWPTSKPYLNGWIWGALLTWPFLLAALFVIGFGA